ncbi:hypothetical protein [Coleofasciculus sp. E1-EBD-02]|uniref:hypothetical protein n=1 Tax=Coleofasciculus sp. E1-EBD-02 TaxID=3068481 RepID=UPI0040649822
MCTDVPWHICRGGFHDYRFLFTQMKLNPPRLSVELVCSLFPVPCSLFPVP